MSLTINLHRQPADTILPSLSYLKQYHKYYTNITQVFQTIVHNKTKDIKNIQIKTSQFINKMQWMYGICVEELDNFIKNSLSQVDFDDYQQEAKIQRNNNVQYQEPTKTRMMEMNQQRIPRLQNQNKIVYQQQHNRQNKSKYHLRSKSKLSKTPLKILSPSKSIARSKSASKIKSKLRYKFKTQQFTEQLRSQIENQINRQSISSNPFTFQTKQKKFTSMLSPNDNICPAHIRLINFAYTFKRWQHQSKLDVKFIKCEECDSYIRSSRFNALYFLHFQQVHKKKINHRMSVADRTIPIKELYVIYKQKIDNGQLVLYKCHCMKQFLPTQQQYVKHIFKNHQGASPPYSSHLFLDPSEPNSIKLNQQYPQYLLIEDLLYPTMYYCGICNLPFMNFCQLYFMHMMTYHNGQVGKYSSHILVKNYRQNYFKIIQNSKNDDNLENKSANKLINTRTPIKKQKKYVLATPQQKSPNLINKNTQLSQGQQVLKYITQIYEGPFSCRSCQTIFKSYAQMKLHYQKGTSQEQLKHYCVKQNFLKVSVNMIRPSRKYYIPIQPDQKIRNLQILVPFSVDSKFQFYKKITIGKLIEYVRERSKSQLYSRPSVFSWFEQQKK